MRTNQPENTEEIRKLTTHLRNAIRAGDIPTTAAVLKDIHEHGLPMQVITKQITKLGTRIECEIDPEFSRDGEPRIISINSVDANKDSALIESYQKLLLELSSKDCKEMLPEELAWINEKNQLPEMCYVAVLEA